MFMKSAVILLAFAIVVNAFCPLRTYWLQGKCRRCVAPYGRLVRGQCFAISAAAAASGIRGAAASSSGNAFAAANSVGPNHRNHANAASRYDGAAAGSAGVGASGALNRIPGRNNNAVSSSHFGGSGSSSAGRAHANGVHLRGVACGYGRC